jgi:NADPH-dependent stearoyl-CoA 9-desaturase
MAISDVQQFAHLTEEEVEQLGRELDELRAEIEESRGADDAAYINRIIKIQRGLAFGGRVALLFSGRKPAFAAGMTMLGLAKILENMEIGHNVMHGQWDWMNDPEIHSSNWEWDTAQPAEQWKHSHNYVHHQFTNVLGHDNDIGYGIMRLAREQKWHPHYLGQPIYNALLATLFQWGVALHDLDLERIAKGEKDPQEMKRQLLQIGHKVRNQVIKDYVVYPALSGPNWRTTLMANAGANLMRNLWSYMVIFCGHFPDGALHFTEEELEDETRAEWYLRQMLGSANFDAGDLMAIMSGNLCYQIEHHLFPDLPSNRYAQISVRVRELAAKYDLPYTTGPLHRQYGQALRTIMKLSLPNRFTKPDREDLVDADPEQHHRERRLTDAERQTRRRELGGWSRGKVGA